MSTNRTFFFKFRRDGNTYDIQEHPEDGLFRVYKWAPDLKNEHPFQRIVTYGSMDAVINNWFFKTPVWYAAEPLEIPEALAPLLATEINKLKKRGRLSEEAHKQLYRWEGRIWGRDNEHGILLFCGNCKKEIDYDARYPTKICEPCKKKITDWVGQKVEYFNEGFGGYGCQGFYKSTKQKAEYSAPYCYIGQKVFQAQEHYFGGIVVTRVEYSKSTQGTEYSE